MLCQWLPLFIPGFGFEHLEAAHKVMAVSNVGYAIYYNIMSYVTAYKIINMT